MSFDVGDKNSVLFTGLSGFWQRFFKDAQDIEAYYQASEVYLGQVYLDLLGSILNIGIVDTPIFNREYWKLFPILETELNFLAGAISDEDRHVYDMPGDIVNADFLQNSVLEPSIVLERDADFTIDGNDGIIQFHSDPFNAEIDVNGNPIPTPGTAWRTVRMAVGNACYDTGMEKYHLGTFKSSNADDSGLRRGDTLRILAYRGAYLTEGTAGSIQNTASQSVFYGTDVGLCRVGDVIQVHGHVAGSPDANDAWKGYYIVKTILSAGSVELESLTVPTTSWSSTTPLYWKQYRATYFEVDPTKGSYFRDYELDYYEGMKGIGSPANPYPLDLEGPVITATVRDVPSPDVIGVSLVFRAEVSGVAPANPFVVGMSGTITDLGTRHIIPGSVVIQAYKYVEAAPLAPGDDNRVVEGVDYTVDYLRGIIHQIKYWDSSSVGRVAYQYQTEVALSGATTIEEYVVGNVRQLSYWVPEVSVDRFTLWYNYGMLLNRFDASSEAYKAFLMGIMYLYITGPILSRIESALNVAAEYPLISQDGELLVSYDDGVIGSGAAATITGGTDTVVIPTSEYELSELDVGGYIIFDNPLNARNKGKFRILSVSTSSNSAFLETTYGMTSETPADWVISHTYLKTVVTDIKTYQYPYNVPMRSDIASNVNWNTLTFLAFEPLTTAFTVTDYLEDPQWWQNRVIPPLLWDAGSDRRRSSAVLFEHVFDAIDSPCIGDPGLYFDAGEEGIVLNPTDPRPLDINTIAWQSGTTVRYTLNRSPDLSNIDTLTPVTMTVTGATNATNDGTLTITAVSLDAYWVEVTNALRTDSTDDEASNSPASATLTGAVIPVSILRHNTAFILFDRYMKMHTYFIEFDIGLDLDTQFREDLEDLVLIAKPAYTYPVVEPNAQFLDNVGLTNDFVIPLITFLFGEDTDGGLSSLHLPDTNLVLDDPNFPWYFGDFFKYSTQALTPTVTDPIPVGTVVDPVLPAGCSLLALNVVATRTVDGGAALEGRDYTVDWRSDNPLGTANPTKWAITFLTECSSGGLTLPLTCYVAERVNGSYNTTLGWTPTIVDGTNPWYIRGGALDPTSLTFAAEWEALRTEYIDRTLQLTVVPDTDTPSVSYTYP